MASADTEYLEETEITLNNKTVDQVSHFSYLGRNITCDTDHEVG